MMVLDAVMMVIMLVLLGMSVAAVVWMIRKDENFRLWMNCAILRYYNQSERLHERLVKLARRKE
jgi:hypothetical protein